MRVRVKHTVGSYLDSIAFWIAFDYLMKRHSARFSQNNNKKKNPKNLTTTNK